MDVDAERARKLAERRQRGVVLLGHDRREQASRERSRMLVISGVST